MLCQGTHGRRRRRAALPEAELVRAEQLQVALGGRGGYRARQAVAITDERRGQVGSSRMALFRVGAVYAGNVILFFDGAMFWQVADLGSPVPSTRAVGPGLAQAPGGVSHGVLLGGPLEPAPEGRRRPPSSRGVGGGDEASPAGTLRLLALTFRHILQQSRDHAAAAQLPNAHLWTIVDRTFQLGTPKTNPCPVFFFFLLSKS